MRVILDFRDLAGPLDLSGFTPDWALTMSAAELASRQVWRGNDPISLGELCHLDRDPIGPDELVLSGATGWLDRVGERMAAGRLYVDGDLGNWAGAEMRAGELIIRGDAGLGLGAAMQEGTIRCRGNAGGHTGAALPGRKVGMSGEPSWYPAIRASKPAQ